MSFSHVLYYRARVALSPVIFLMGKKSHRIAINGFMTLNVCCDVENCLWQDEPCRSPILLSDLLWNQIGLNLPFLTDLRDVGFN